MVMFLIISFQSCAVGFVNAVEENKEDTILLTLNWQFLGTTSVSILVYMIISTYCNY